MRAAEMSVISSFSECRPEVPECLPRRTRKDNADPSSYAKSNGLSAAAVIELNSKVRVGFPVCVKY
jgi:hypothetical protein